VTTKERQRALARAKLERQMARRAAEASKRRRVIAGVAAAAGLAVLIGATIWLVVSLNKDDGGSDALSCSYTSVPAGALVKDVGSPPTKDVADTGSATATMVTSSGTLTIDLDRAEAPCTVNSWSYLAGKHFFDNTICHRMTDALVQCGDPFATQDGTTNGQGGPSYRFGTENLPVNVHPAYAKGVVAMANSGSEDSTGSQFFVLWDEASYSADYTIVGHVASDAASTATLDALKAVGNDGSMDPSPGGGRPNQTVTITSLTVA
jgi:peptidyl-prolyl cis-trans isomerase B (cyclophilin B)